MQAVLKAPNGIEMILTEAGWTCRIAAIAQEMNMRFPYPPLDTWHYDPNPMATVAQNAAAVFGLEVVEMPIPDKPEPGAVY